VSQGPTDFGSLKGGGDCAHHYHKSDRFPTRDTMLWMQSLQSVRTLSASDTAAPNDDILVVDIAGLTVTLPPAKTGRIYVISSIGLGTATIVPAGVETVNGGASYSLGTASVVRLKAILGGWIHI